MWMNLFQNYFKDFNIILSDDDDDLIIYKKKLYPIYRFFTEECNIISFYILEDIIRIERINKCNSYNTTNFILNFIDFFKDLNLIYYIEIEIDVSYLKFYDIKIDLSKLSLLTYGMTYYNRLGFGKQNEEWLLFIENSIVLILNKIIHINLEDIKIIEDFSNIFIKYEDETISSVFLKVKKYLQTTEEELLDRNILQIIKRILELIFKITPKISKEMKLYLK